MWYEHIKKWLWPLYFIFLSILFGYFIPGHSFIGLVCFGIAIIISCYFLFDIWEYRQGKVAQRFRTVFTSLLMVGLAVFLLTEAIILYASFRSKENDYKYMVVLGARVYDTAPSLSLLYRIETAYTHLEENPEVIAILSGGQGSDEGISEAACMFRELTSRGIAAERLWLEDKSTSTWENLNFSLDLIQEKTGNRPAVIGLLTSEYHLFRAGLFANDCGVTARRIPSETILFSLRLNNLMREAAGVWHYLILGGQYHD